MMNKEEFDNWLSDTVAMVHEQGYRVIPVYEKSPAKYADGQTYVEMHHYNGAVSVGVVLDNCVLLDYDGNKADEAGEEIIDLETLAATLGLEEMPECVQEGSNGRSLHFLFSRGDRDVRMASRDGWLPHVDLKTKNQLMILKHGKNITDFELPRADELPPCPELLLEAFSGRTRDLAAVPDEDDVARALEDLKAARSLHGPALTIVNSLIFEGKTADEIEQHFEGLRDYVQQRDRERVERFYGGELQDIINSGLDKYRDRVPSVGFEVIGEPARVAPTDVDWSDYVFVRHENAVMTLSSGALESVAAFNASLLGAKRVVVGPNGKPKVVPALHYLMEHVRSEPVYARVYAPAWPVFFEWRGERCANSYMPQLVPQAADNWTFSDCWRVIEAHYLGLFDDPADGEFLLDWMAHNVQHPGRKILWTPVVLGVQGDGKTSIKNILTLVMGEQNVRDIDYSSLASAFNAYAEGACVAVLEELRVTGQSRYSVLDALKPLITNEIISITRKGKDSIQVPNTQNYLGLTNHADALPVDKNDRRYAILKTKYYDNREQMLEDTGKEYWQRFHDSYKKGNNAQIIRGWLLSRDISGFDRAFPPPMSPHKLRMIEDSRSPEEQIIMDVIEDFEDCFTSEEVVRECRKEGVQVHGKRVGKVAGEMGFFNHQLRIGEARRRVWCSSGLSHMRDKTDQLNELIKRKRDQKQAADFQRF